MQKGTLKIRDVKKGKEYRLVFENAKGKTQDIVIQPPNRLFDLNAVVDGDPVEFELQNGIPVKCAVPGKEAAPVVKERAPAPRETGGTTVSRPRNTARARCDAVAPYNFVPFDSTAVIPAPAGEARLWSGSIVCKLEALTPLLVSGKQVKASQDQPSECRFMQVGGKNIIPGTSIKGMLRSLLEILTFSNMLPVSDKHLFWRRVNMRGYRAMFAQDEVPGGYLRKNGAEYSLVPVHVSPGHHPEKGCEFVETGGFYNPQKRIHSTMYNFHQPPANAPQIAIPAEVVNNFWAQLTPNQESEKRWNDKKRDKRLTTAPGLPVFYRLDESGQVAELGFCRYFRLAYKYSPKKLAYPDGVHDEPDFATTLFGTAKGKAFRGRVSVEPAIVEGRLFRQEGLDVVPGGPKPTCLPLYVDQDPSRVRTFSNGKKNDPDSMMSYNDRAAMIRGRKLYWHHDVDENFFPGKETMTKKDGSKNFKVISRLYPVAAGSTARIVIHVDHLADCELGALLEAIELPAGHAHKLGMGKSLGLGSIRLKIEEARIEDMSIAHKSLAARLGGGRPLTRARMDELRDEFRKKILVTAHGRKADWKQFAEYDKLPPIRALRLMMDYEHRPKPAQVRTMTLAEFGSNAILPPPEEALKQGG